MIVRGESTIIDYHAPFDQGFTVRYVFLSHKWAYLSSFLIQKS